MRSLLLAIALLFSSPAWCADYYIDFATGSDANAGTSKEAPWKRAPGMASFAGTYTHAAGDRFIFKGGVTWDYTIFNWTISNSGTSGHVDYYGVDQTWYAGSSWSKPILDGDNRVAGNNVNNIAITGSYVTFDNFKIQNLGVAYDGNQGRAITSWNTSNLTISNNTFTPYVRTAINYYSTTVGTLENIILTGNDIANVSWGITADPLGAGVFLDNVVISENIFHDFATGMCNGAHGDAIVMFNYAHADTGAMKNVHIYNNRTYGDFSVHSACYASCPAGNPCGMNAFIFAQDGETGATYNIYNNVFSYSAIEGYAGGTSNASRFLNLQGAYSSDTAEAPTYNVWNNTFHARDAIMHFGTSFTNTGNSTISYKNNIHVGGYAQLMTSGATTCTAFLAGADNNLYYGASNYIAVFGNSCDGGFQSTWNTYHTVNGHEPNSISANPLFTDAPSDFSLQSGSPARGIGVNLTSLAIDTLNEDIIGNTRDAVDDWDLGAYTYESSPPVTYTVGGTLSGAAGSVVLQNNLGDNLTAGNGAFTFSTAIAAGSTYSVTVLSPPAGQSCSVVSGSGVISGNVTNVAVTCSNIVISGSSSRAGRLFR